MQLSLPITETSSSHQGVLMGHSYEIARADREQN